MGEDDGVHRVEVEQDRRVRSARERCPDVHHADLEGEEEAQEDQRAPLAALDPEPREAASGPRPERDDGAPDQEAHPGQPERRRVEEPDLDRDRIGAPEDRDDHGQRGALEIDAFRGMAQSASTIRQL